MAILQHLLFVFLLVVAPAWDYYDTRMLKRNPTSSARVRYYATICAWLWAATIVAFVIGGRQSLVVMRPALTEIPWLLQHLWVRCLVVLPLFGLAAIAVWTYLSVLLMRVRNQPRKYKSSEVMQKLSYAYLFPATPAERRWWAVVALTAGVCEEVLFRGFLLHYLHRSPWQLNLTVALLVSAIIFGLQHLYQGAIGAVTSAVMGVLFGILFVLSGSLLLPILLHAALDLRMLVILPPANVPREQSVPA